MSRLINVADDGSSVTSGYSNPYALLVNYIPGYNGDKLPTVIKFIFHTIVGQRPLIEP